MNKVDLIESAHLRTDVPPFRPGDQVRVHVNIREGGRERIQVFEGVVIARRGGGIRESFTVRKISFGVGVERTFPLHAPAVAKVEVVRHGKVRRAKLYYLRELTGRRAKIEERRTRIPTWATGGAEATALPEDVEQEAAEAAEGAEGAEIVDEKQVEQPAADAGEPAPSAEAAVEAEATAEPEAPGAEIEANPAQEPDVQTEETERGGS